MAFTPPDDTAGVAVEILSGERKLIAGLDDSKAVRVYRTSDTALASRMQLRLMEPVNGVLSMENVSSADRVAGLTTYRAVMLKAHGAVAVQNIRIWHDLSKGPRQAEYSFASEAPGSGGDIQTIADEETAPAAVSWVTATERENGLLISSIPAGEMYGLWVRRVLNPVGHVETLERMGMGVYFESHL
jgi:hypothetical protein